MVNKIFIMFVMQRLYFKNHSSDVVFEPFQQSGTSELVHQILLFYIHVFLYVQTVHVIHTCM